MAKSNSQRLYLSVALALISCSVAFACKGQLLVSGITEDDKRAILHEHNKLRQIVATGRYPGQPSAENMREIVWDNELAVRAQQWANNCEFRHDPLRTINRFTMGQNLAIIWSTAPLAANDGNFPSRIQSWFNEVQKYSFGDAWSPKTGHYSQLVWGETSLVGCGYSEYKDATRYNKLYVCNYGPGGNVVGYNPYAVGKPSCASYGLRSSPRYQGLCAAHSYASSSPSYNTINSNSIETYEYKQSNEFYNKHTTAFTSTQYAQQTTTPSPSSYPQQASAGDTSKVLISRANYGAIRTGGYSFGTKTYGGSTAHTTETNQQTQQQQQRKYQNKLEAYKPSSAEFHRSVLKHTILRTSSSDSGSRSSSDSANVDVDVDVDETEQQQSVSEPELALVQEPSQSSSSSSQQSSYEFNQQQEQSSSSSRGKYQNLSRQEKLRLQHSGYYIHEADNDEVNTPSPAKSGWSLLTWRG